jgi:hypothetical protein
MTSMQSTIHDLYLLSIVLVLRVTNFVTTITKTLVLHPQDFIDHSTSLNYA